MNQQIRSFNNAIATVETGLNAAMVVFERVCSDNAKLQEALNKEIQEKNKVIEEKNALHDQIKELTLKLGEQSIPEENS